VQQMPRRLFSAIGGRYWMLATQAYLETHVRRLDQSLTCLTIGTIVEMRWRLLAL